MLVHQNNSDTAIIVLHEIYGINEHIINVGKELSKRKYDIFVPNFLDEGTVFSYEQAAIAYRSFMDNIGFKNAMKQVERLLQCIRLRYRYVYVLGYSIGATVAWLCSQTGLCDLVVGFYGSRIRDYLTITPQCPTLLFFPAEELFDVDAVIVELNRVTNVSVRKVFGEHGFADCLSQHYDRRLTLMAMKEVLLFLKSISR